MSDDLKEIFSRSSTRRTIRFASRIMNAKRLLSCKTFCLRFLYVLVSFCHVKCVCENVIPIVKRMCLLKCYSDCKTVCSRHLEKSSEKCIFIFVFVYFYFNFLFGRLARVSIRSKIVGILGFFSDDLKKHSYALVD